MRYFNDCKTAEEVKSTFFKLAKELHPDNGGDAESFKKMMAEYRIAFERLKNIHTTKEGKTYERTGDNATTETPDEFADVINRVIFFDGVTVEIIGSWVWLTGNTMAYKDDIKAAGFWWSRSKKAWYYNGDSKHSHRRGHYSLDGLRDKWGTETVKKGKQVYLTA